MVRSCENNRWMEVDWLKGCVMDGVEWAGNQQAARGRGKVDGVSKRVSDGRECETDWSENGAW